MQSTDLEEVRAIVGRIFRPHGLSVVTGHHGLLGRMHHARLGDVSLNLLDYGSEVVIDPGRLENFFLLQIPLQGSAEIECGNRRFVSSPQTASLLSPSLPLRMRWGDACPQVILRVERGALEQHCERHLGDAFSRPVEFEPELQLASPGGAYLMQLLPLLADAMSMRDHPLTNPLAFSQFESTLINALIYGQPNTARDGIRRPAGTLAPFFVRRVEEFIRANVREPLTIERIAEHAGVSASSLFAGFKNYYGMSPMNYVRQLRLERVREELLDLQASGNGSITEIATRWGFAHLGRFSIEYKKHFGESPSDCLRRRPLPVRRD
ncbi:AraC family transcriptional regulator [Paraburkholderia sp. MMS20-SJTR3]|uniref:AraC family transcriptional regulator n=1 Tax=Paraburkholderia sejongensis TaxID=2886946 RepID=A0ABS8JUR0_9BURK|nr:AraC family transcriptional regulator [Paraburkholderia sp. MMS20-SJTR3]MCC8393619.1 AraC family transcriptional regulator [Paraburkholderia sp. MMS20-SJTR3]